MKLEVREILVWILIPPLIHCMILGNLINLSKGQFPYQQNSDDDILIVIKIKKIYYM